MKNLKESNEAYAKEHPEAATTQLRLNMYATTLKAFKQVCLSSSFLPLFFPIVSWSLPGFAILFSSDHYEF
jgi:hypothetical protein